MINILQWYLTTSFLTIQVISLSERGRNIKRLLMEMSGD